METSSKHKFLLLNKKIIFLLETQQEKDCERQHVPCKKANIHLIYVFNMEFYYQATEVYCSPVELKSNLW